MKSAKFLLGFLMYTLTTIVVVAAIGFWWLSREYAEPGPLQVEVFSQIEPGTSLNGIARQLQDEGVIGNTRVFSWSARILGDQSRLKAGEYRFLPGMSTANVLHMMSEGEVFQRRVTLREGLTSYEVVTLLKNVQELSGDVTDIPAEGMLLPGTYDYRRDEPRERVIGRMQQAMTDTLDELWAGRAENLPLTTKEEALTLASIVEKETGVAAERRRVAGVFVNRLRQGVPLQTDPTVIYALTKGRPENEGQGPLGRRLLSKDLEIDSPYNTYLHPGLPPGPIASPGRDSLEAALHPEEHKFLYFVADGTGGHVFAETLEEHTRNVTKWRQIRKESP